MGERGSTAVASCSIPGNSEGAGQIESLVPSWVCQRCCPANLNKLLMRKAKNSSDEDLEKRKGEIYFSAGSLDKCQAQALTTHLSAHQTDT